MSELVKLKFFLFLLLPLIATATIPCEKKLDAVKDDCNRTKIVDKVTDHTLCSWNKLVWEDNSAELDQTTCGLLNESLCGNQIASTNIPWKIVIIDPYVYVFVRRERPGTYSSLNFFKLSDVVDNDEDGDGSVQCPALDCYPNCQSVQFFDSTTCALQTPVIVDAVDIYLDRCGRLWVFDTGYYFDGTQLVFETSTKICAYDANGVQIGSCITFDIQYILGTWSSMIVNENELECTGASNQLFFYLINGDMNYIVVYSLETDEFWEYRSVRFLPEPSQSNFEIDLPNNNEKYTFIVTTGIYNVIKGFLGLYFSCVAGDDIYHIPFTVLNNKTIAESCEFNYNIQEIGSLNDNGQCTGMVSDGDVMYFLQIQNSAIACVNKKEGVNPDNFQLISIDKNKFSSACSIQIHQDNTDCKKVYILSNNKYVIELNGLNENTPNFIISYIDVKDVEAIYPGCIAHFSELYTDQSDQSMLQYPFEREMRDQYYLASAISSQNVKSVNNEKVDQSYNPFIGSPYIGPNSGPLYSRLYYAMTPQQSQPQYKMPEQPQCTQSGQKQPGSLIYGM